MIKIKNGTVYDVFGGNRRVSEIYKGNSKVYGYEYAPSLVHPWYKDGFDDKIWFKLRNPAQQYKLDIRGGYSNFDKMDVIDDHGTYLLQDYSNWVTVLSFDLEEYSESVQIVYHKKTGFPDGSLHGNREVRSSFFSYGEQQVLPQPEYQAQYNFYVDKYLTDVYIGDQAGVQALSQTAFAGNSALKNIRLPSTLRFIQTQTVYVDQTPYKFGVFYSCRSLEDVDLRNTNLLRVEENTFSLCDTLKRIILPPSVRYFNVNSAQEVPKLEKLVLLSEEPPAVYAAEAYRTAPDDLLVYFLDTVAQNFKVKVPRQSVYKYRNSPGWRNLPIEPFTEEDFL